MLGQPVPVALEDGPDLLHAFKAGPVGDTAGGIEPDGRVLLGEVQQAQADTVSLLRVLPPVELATHPGARVRTDVAGPAL